MAITKGQEKMYHPEKLATYGAQKKKQHEHICMYEAWITDLLYVSFQVLSIVLCLSL
jgi:hypothetical protein